MIPNPLLSITIPTYNRADFLDYSLEIHIPLARAYNVQIYISDNASTDTTKKIVEKWQNEYPLIHYFHNEINVGPDKNFELALKYPKTAYIWLLGDTYQIPQNGINDLIEILLTKNKNYDAIIVDVMKRVYGIPQQEYSNQNKLLSDLGWHMTCLSSLIYNTKLISHANFERYYHTSFIQTGIIFENIANKDFLIYWEQNISIKLLQPPHVSPKIGWYRQPIIFEIACVHWSNFIFSLPPSYHLEAKLQCTLEHGEKSGLFSFQNLVLLSTTNILNYRSYKKYSHLFPLTIQYSKFTIFLISLLPTKSYIFLKFLANLIKKKPLTTNE